MIDHIDHHVQPPSHEAFWPTDLFTQGLGWVILARFKSGGARVQAGVFLIDVFCLGAKLAFYEDCDAIDYRLRIRDHYQAEFPMVATAPACARKLIEQAVQYASQWGLAPHADYQKATRVFSGVSAESCAQQFTFGHKGKPFYRRGPNTTEAQARRIVEQLERRCGAGNFDYVVALGKAEDILRNYFG
jgi:hypothetical protein